jgi:hypothetical protein
MHFNDLHFENVIQLRLIVQLLLNWIGKGFCHLFLLRLGDFHDDQIIFKTKL